jgi:exonuclease VII small subunit
MDEQTRAYLMGYEEARSRASHHIEALEAEMARLQEALSEALATIERLTANLPR